MYTASGCVDILITNEVVYTVVFMQLIKML